MITLSGRLELWHVLVLVALFGIGEALFTPAFVAIVPDIVPKNLLVEANSLDQLVRPLAMRFVGPALGGLLVTLAGGTAGGAFIFDASTFVVSAVCITAVTARPREARSVAESSVFREIREGLDYVRSQRWLWGALAAAAVGLLCLSGPLHILVPIVVKNKLGGALDYGLILAAMGAGAVFASLLMGQRGLPPRYVTIMYLGWSLGTAVIATFAFVTASWQAMLASLFMGFVFTVGIIVWGTLVHTLVPSGLLGRVSSFDWMVSLSLVPVSYALTGVIAGTFGTYPTLFVSAIAGGIALMAGLMLPGIRDPETQPALRAAVAGD